MTLARLIYRVLSVLSMTYYDARERPVQHVKSCILPVSIKGYYALNLSFHIILLFKQ